MENDTTVAEAPEVQNGEAGEGKPRARVHRRSEAVSGGRAQIPRDLYRVRCINSKLGQSQAGADMITLTCEILEPETITVPTRDGDMELNVAGNKFQLWLILDDDNDWGSARVYDFMDKLELNVVDEFDPNEHEQIFRGMAWDMILDSEENIARKPKKEGQKVGDPIKDGEGKPISLGWRIKADITEVLQHCRPEMTELPPTAG